jgi:hypothetical protein
MVGIFDVTGSAFAELPATEVRGLFPMAFGKVESFAPSKKIYLSVSMPETIPIDFPSPARGVDVAGSGHYR